MATTPKAHQLMMSLQKKFGENKVMMASSIPVGPPISSGSLALDFATGYGGFPSDRTIEICGKPGCGKTTLALLTMMNALAKYPRRNALFLDVEHKITKEWLEMIVGKEMLDNRIIYVQPTSIENATNIYREALESELICCAILDSVGGAPTVRRNDDAETGHYGGNAIGMGEFSRATATHGAVYNCLTIGINQTRVDMSGYNQLVTPGGRAWTHAPVLRIELVRGKETETVVIDTEKVPIGYNIFAKVRKNQVGPEGRTAMYWFFNTWTEQYGFGIDQLDEITRLGIKTKVFDQRGGWYHHPALDADAKGEHKVQGLEKLKATIRADEILQATLRSEILASLAEHGADVAPISDPLEPSETVGNAFPLLVLSEDGEVETK